MSVKSSEFHQQNDTPDNSLRRIKKFIESAENSLKEAKGVLGEILGESIKLDHRPQDFSISNDKIIEGTFDGENMQSNEGKIFSVPANYASKSKLVEGDRLKLTIADDGTFIFKQIGPVVRKKLIGELIKDDNQYYVISDKKKYKVISASITYFKGKEGDEVTIIVPEKKPSLWAAVEAVI
jgi:hypothetical protein